MEINTSGICNEEVGFMPEEWIVKEFRDYSVKRRQKPGESDAQYRKYLAKREKALAKVSGTPLDEVAQAYAREFGADSKEVAEEMIISVELPGETSAPKERSGEMIVDYVRVYQKL